jgi:hypothetical protein
MKRIFNFSKNRKLYAAAVFSATFRTPREWENTWGSRECEYISVEQIITC